MISCWCYDCKRVFKIKKGEEEICIICSRKSLDSKLDNKNKDSKLLKDTYQKYGAKSAMALMVAGFK